MTTAGRAHRLVFYQQEIRGCTLCSTAGLLHVDVRKGVAYPVLHKEPTAALGILIVGEAPNFDDTFNEIKGYLTCDPNTDPSGQFMFELLVDVVGLTEEQVKRDVLFTNAVACLPRRRNDRYPVRAKQLGRCRPWLVRLIEDVQPGVVVAMGAKALHALGKIEKHGLTLKTGVGRLHPWFGRRLLPIYHPGLLGRVTRKAEQQREDIVPLREHLRVTKP